MVSTNSSERKEGELSAEEAALAKRIFVGLGFLGIGIVIVALVSLIPIEYVLASVIIFGLLVVTRFEFAHPTKS